MSVNLNITLSRNEDYCQQWALADNAGVAIDITGWTIALHVRKPDDNATIVQHGDITIVDAVNGKFDVLLKASEGSALFAWPDTVQTEILPYDLRVSDTENVKTVLVSGNVVLTRGKTFI